MVAGQKAEWRDRYCAVELSDFAVRGVKKWGWGRLYCLLRDFGPGGAWICRLGMKGVDCGPWGVVNACQYLFLDISAIIQIHSHYPEWLTGREPGGLLCRELRYPIYAW